MEVPCPSKVQAKLVGEPEEVLVKLTVPFGQTLVTLLVKLATGFPTFTKAGLVIVSLQPLGLVTIN